MSELQSGVFHLNQPITRIGDLPKFNRIIGEPVGGIASAARAEVTREICILETGVNRAVIIVCEDALSWIKPHVTQIRANLITRGFTLAPKDLVCSRGLINQLRADNAYQKGDSADLETAFISGSEARRLFEKWVEIAVEQRATDLHIQIINSVAEVKIRVDGDLEYLPDEQGGVYTPLQAECAIAWAYNNASGKGSNSSSQFSNTENLYCMIAPRDVAGRRVSLRYQSVRGWGGVKVVCRLLYVEIDQPTLSYEELGYAVSHIELLEAAARLPSGMILFSGVTGSGKTTTLKTFVETHPDSGIDAFYSIEDPVEYPLRNVHQIPIQRDLIDSQGSAAKYREVIAALMRADPGCVLMGEIRDQATAKSAQQIVETGHMACGTVHAHLISGIVPRLTNEEIGMSRDVLTNPNMLTLLAYQALVPKLCSNCKLTWHEYTQGGGKLSSVAIGALLESKFNLSPINFCFKRQGGCSHCRGRGTNGLTVVAELLAPDRTWLRLIRDHKDFDALEYFRSMSDRKFDSPNMHGKTVFEHALFKASLGEIDLRHCEKFDSLERFRVLDAKARDSSGREFV